MVGKTVAHYEILEKLGEGAMGAVYKARDTQLDRPVALKFLSPQLSQAEHQKQRFMQEAKAASALDHPNICTIYEIHDPGQTSGQLFMVMACYEGESLKDKIQGGALPVEESVNLAIQIGNGLDKAHAKGIVHRDIKPANVFVTEDGQAKIIDFGLAKLVDRTLLTREGTTLGTAAYMSPEQVRGDPVDHRTDIWALGVVLYEMLTGQRPFNGDYEQALWYSILNAEAEPLRSLRQDLPADLERIVARTLEKDPGRRYQKVADLTADLKRVKRDEESAEVFLPNHDDGSSRKVTTKKVVIGGAAVVMLALAFLMSRLLSTDEISEHETVPIAVISFENQTGEQTYDRLQKVIPNLLITSLEESKHFRVTTWERMYDLLRQIGREEVEMIDSDLGFELCRMDEVDAIVLGSVTKLGDVFVTDVKVLDVRTKKILKSARSEGKGVSSIIEKQIDDLAGKIAEGVGLSARAIAAGRRPVADMTTQSMEAYTYFLNGREEAQRFHYAKAIELLEKSVALDSTFAMAYRELATSYLNVGEKEAHNEAWEKAKRHSGMATEKEKLLIEAGYVGAIERDPQKRIHILGRLTERYPNDKYGRRELAFSYRVVGSWEKAVEEYEKVLELDPYESDVWNELGYLYRQLGNYELAMKSLEKYASLSPGEPNPYDSMGELFFEIGRLDDAIASYRKALELAPDFWSSNLALSYVFAFQEDYQEANRRADRGIARPAAPGVQAWGYFVKGFYAYWSGRYNQAMQELSTADSLSRIAGAPDHIARIDWLRSWIYRDKGDLAAARKLTDRWHSILNTYPVTYNLELGLLYLQEGEIDSAKQVLVKLDEHFKDIDRGWEDWSNFYYGLLQGEILLAENAAEDAIVVLEQKSPVGHGHRPMMGLIEQQIMMSRLPQMKDVLARAYHRAGRLDEAVEEYEKLTTVDPNRPGRDLINPRYYYRLARLYEEKGLADRAIQRYERFLGFWKNADVDLSQRKDAEQRLTRLRAAAS